MAIGKVAAHLCLTLMSKELKISDNNTKYNQTLNIIFSVLVSSLEEYCHIIPKESDQRHVFLSSSFSFKIQ